MRGLKIENEKDMQQEQQLLKRYKKELAELPRGSLTFYRKKGKLYYKHIMYARGKDGKSVRVERHLGQKDEDLILALQRKAFLKEVCRRMTQNLKLQQRMLQKYEDYDCYSIWDTLRDVYKPVNVMAFFRQEGLQVSHVDEKGQTYRPSGLRQNTTGGFDVRSKGESLIAEGLMARGIVFQFENEFTVKLGSGQIITLHSDFRIPTRDGGVILWEHLGRLYERKYAQDTGDRLFLYNQAGFNPGKNLILTADDKDGNTDVNAIAQILDWLETVCLFEE